MSKRLVELYGSLENGESPCLCLYGAVSLAGGTGLLLPELLRVVFHECLESSLDQPQSRDGGDFFHSSKGELSALGHGSSRDNFSPVGGESLEMLQLIGWEMVL